MSLNIREVGESTAFSQVLCLHLHAGRKTVFVQEKLNLGCKNAFHKYSGSKCDRHIPHNLIRL